VLVTKGTSDETFRYVSQTRERAMVQGIRNMSAAPAPVPAPSTPTTTRQVNIQEFDSAMSPATRNTRAPRPDVNMGPDFDPPGPAINRR